VLQNGKLIIQKKDSLILGCPKTNKVLDRADIKVPTGGKIAFDSENSTLFIYSYQKEILENSEFKENYGKKAWTLKLQSWAISNTVSQKLEERTIPVSWSGHHNEDFSLAFLNKNYLGLKTESEMIILKPEPELKVVMKVVFPFVFSDTKFDKNLKLKYSRVFHIEGMRFLNIEKI
jgi:hypothetical protein